MSIIKKTSFVFILFSIILVGCVISASIDSAYAQSVYARSEFGAGWIDSDKDCQNTRMEVLNAQSTAPVRFRSNKQCHITAGRWISVFTNKVIQDPTSIDIDHLVPLKWAWFNGAAQWTREQRIVFANDPVNLLSVEASLNRQKGAKGPEQWLPPKNQCAYVARFFRVIRTYDLTPPPSAINFYRAFINECRSIQL
ncbi:MAG: HNH endonuclease family protein [Glaciecola sp.]|nr:HNH endonuclease family protein [Glaciecola sp.]MDG1815641.1 HNH endonuclease family protein [Glaciecola sp.]MDG2098160.1 HNH endonuclease family protein [Glaciecola sp.]